MTGGEGLRTDTVRTALTLEEVRFHAGNLYSVLGSLATTLDTSAEVETEVMGSGCIDITEQEVNTSSGEYECLLYELPKRVRTGFDATAWSACSLTIPNRNRKIAPSFEFLTLLSPGGAEDERYQITEWSVGEKTEGDIFLHNGVVYQAETTTSEEPPHDDWAEIGALIDVSFSGNGPARFDLNNHNYLFTLKNLAAATNFAYFWKVGL